MSKGKPCHLKLFFGQKFLLPSSKVFSGMHDDEWIETCKIFTQMKSHVNKYYLYLNSNRISYYTDNLNTDKLMRIWVLEKQLKDLCSLLGLEPLKYIRSFENRKIRKKLREEETLIYKRMF